MTNPLVYISILNWNRVNLTLNCIATLSQQTYDNYRILVVDNASQDNSVDRIQSKYPEITILCSQVNTGYAGGHQLAVNKALEDDADLLWIVNNDTQIEPHILSYLVSAYQQKGSGIYGGVPLKNVKEESKVLIHYKYLNPQYKEIIFDINSFKEYNVLFPEPEKIQEVSAISGSCFLLPLEIVSQHGFMDTAFFMYSEEVDYCFRLRQKNIPIWIVPEATILHESEGSSSSTNSVLSDVVQYYRIRNQIIRIQRYGSAYDIIRAMLKNIILLGLPLSRLQFRRVQFMIRGMLDGMMGRLGKTISPENYLD